jgi:ribosomal protein S18 acetylase RimI-like enzyme
MINRFASGGWRGVKNPLEIAGFLRIREPYCVGAADRFLRGWDHAWFLPDARGGIQGLLIHSKGTLFPVFNQKTAPAPPRFIGRLLGQTAIHAVQGIRRETAVLETGLAAFGALPYQRIDYDLMGLDKTPNLNALRGAPRNLIVRPPNPRDTDRLFQMQADYEREEVLLPGAVFSPAACRLALEHILAHERVLLAELEGCIIGKINTNAASFSRYQIGGVYVSPERRGAGVGSHLITAFVRDLVAAGNGVTLFVKKQNAGARRVYRRVGFAALDDYRISYY